MNAKPRHAAAGLFRVAVCFLMIAAAAAAVHGRLFPGASGLLPGAWRVRPASAAGALVLVLAAVVPLFARSRRFRTALLWLDVAVLGVWAGFFLSVARMAGWAAWAPNKHAPAR